MKRALQAFMIVAMLAAFPAGFAAAAQTGPITGQHLEPELEEAFGVHSVHPVDPAMAAEAAAHGAHGDAAHHGEAHSSGGLPQLDPTWFASQLFWLTLTFGFLYLVFSNTVLPALSNTIETRRNKIDTDLDKARKMKEDAERVHKAYEEALNEARVKANDTFMKAEEKIKEKSAKKLAAFREKSAQDLEKAEGGINSAKARALKDMDTIAAEVASEAAKKIVGVSPDLKKAKIVVANLNKKAA